MKKMSEFNPEELKYVFYGESNRKGIYMRLEQSEEHQGKNFSTSSIFRFLGAYAHLTEDGKIECNSANTKKVWKQMQAQQEDDNEKVRRIYVLLLLLAGISFIMMFVTIFSANSYLPSLCMSMAWIFLGLSKMPYIIYTDIEALRGNKDILQLLRFHSAEHAAINAYYDLKRTPAMEEIVNYSNYSYLCSTTLLARDAWPHLMVGFCRLLPGWWFLVGLAFCMPITLWAHKKNFYFAEVFMLAKPSELEYEVAIQAMSAAVSAQKEAEEPMGDALSHLSDIVMIMEIGEDEDSNGVPMFCIEFGNPDDLEDE